VSLDCIQVISTRTVTHSADHRRAATGSSCPWPSHE